MTEPTFALGTFAAGARPFVGLVLDGRVTSLPEAAAQAGVPLPGPALIDLLEDWPRHFDTLQALAAAIVRDGTPGQELRALRVLPPIPRPSKIMNAAANYSGHLAEMAKYAASGGTPPEAVYKGDKANSDPYLFFKAPSALTGAFDPIVLPFDGAEIDWEAELAVVIGARARRVTAGRALEHVAGYMTTNDVSCRSRLFRKDRPNFKTDWMSSKSWDSFAPTGPFFVPRQFVPDYAALKIRLYVNGEMRQDGLAGDMIFSPEEQIEHASELMTLEPGDTFCTGTVAGVGQGEGNYLRAGDIVECEVEGLGRQRNVVAAAA